MSVSINEDVYVLLQRGTKSKIGTAKLTLADYMPIGGKIFHIEPDNGATYEFIDSFGKPLTNVTSEIINGVEHLSEDCAKVYAYKRTGTPTADKFYVVGKDGDDNMGVSPAKYWTYWDKTLETPAWHYVVEGTQDGIGKGKSNTALIMAKPEYIQTAAEMGQSYDTLWKWLQSINNASANGCNDWFIGSKAELERLRTVVDSNGDHLTTWFDQTGGFYIWASFEHSATRSWYWSCNSQGWDGYYSKDYNARGVALRAF